MLSKRLDVITPSRTLGISSKVKEMKAQLIDVLNQEIICIWDDEMLKAVRKDIENGLKIGRILTKEKFNQECFKVVE